MVFTQDEWAQFADNRRREAAEHDDTLFNGDNSESEDTVPLVCINCGIAFAPGDGQIGDEAAICNACD